MRCFFTLIAAAFVAQTLVSHAIAGAPEHLCDLLAANPYDPLRVVTKGVDSKAIDAEQAIIACSDAVNAHPKELRFQFQLARAYRGADNYDQAVYWYRLAAEAGYAGAQNSLGVMYARGLGLEQSCTKAVEWYLKAAAQGYEIARLNLQRSDCIKTAALRRTKKK